MKGYVDIVCQLYTPREVREGLIGIDERFRKQVRMDKAIWNGVPIAQYTKRMDSAGVEHSLLVAPRAGDLRIKGSTHTPYRRVFEACNKFPERFSGIAGVDPTLGMKQLYELEQAVHEYGFVGAHYYPHWFDIAPDHPYMFPIYAKCIELDIPIMMQMGHNLIYQRDRRLPSVARPITLDRIAILYPELRLIGIHLGVPWTLEMISMAWKHENIYIGGDAYAPRYWPKEIVHYANTYGQDKFMFGTDWPIVDPVRAAREAEQLNLRPESLRKIMRDNAVRVFKLDRKRKRRPAAARPRQR